MYHIITFTPKHCGAKVQWNRRSIQWWRVFHYQQTNRTPNQQGISGRPVYNNWYRHDIKVCRYFLARWRHIIYTHDVAFLILSYMYKGIYKNYDFPKQIRLKINTQILMDSTTWREITHSSRGKSVAIFLCVFFFKSIFEMRLVIFWYTFQWSLLFRGKLVTSNRRYRQSSEHFKHYSWASIFPAISCPTSYQVHKMSQNQLQEWITYTKAVTFCEMNSAFPENSRERIHQFTLTDTPSPWKGWKFSRSYLHVFLFG